MTRRSNIGHVPAVNQQQQKVKLNKFSTKSRAFVDVAPHAPWSPAMQEFAKLIEQKFGRYPKQWQGQVIMAGLKGKDVLIRAGTGMGKSLPIQALVLSRPVGIVLMIVPILALMNNQVCSSRHIRLIEEGRKAAKAWI